MHPYIYRKTQIFVCQLKNKMVYLYSKNKAYHAAYFGKSVPVQKVVKIMGGLGNQMFQYLFYRALQVRYPDEVIKLDLSYFKPNARQEHNGYELDVLFGVDASHNFDTPPFVPYKNYQYIIERGLLYNSTYWGTAGAHIHYIGYWQSEKFFDPLGDLDAVRALFPFPITYNEATKKYLNLIQNASHSVSVHIRRGDYVNNATHDVLDMNYYKRAMRNILSGAADARFFVFSDDIPYCREQFSTLTFDVVFVEGNSGQDSWQDMLLMTHCHSHIIANSSFSWFGAYLKKSKGGRVLCPCKWFRENTIAYRMEDIAPRTWELMPVHSRVGGGGGKNPIWKNKNVLYALCTQWIKKQRGKK